MTERQTTIAIAKMLRSLGCLFVHVPNEGKREAREAAILAAMGTRPGCADLVVMHAASRWATLFLEVKAAAGKPSPQQIVFAHDVERRGGHYVIARTVAEALEAVFAVWPELRSER